MEAFLSVLVENWVAIAIIIVCVLVAAVVYFAALSRMERRVKKAWLEVYETFLSRADKVPLLVELIRDDIPGVQALIAARAATSDMARPSDQKRAAEKAFEEALGRVLSEVALHPSLKKNALVLELLKEFQVWPARLQTAIAGYTRTLRMYRRVALGGQPEGYGEFTY